MEFALRQAKARLSELVAASFKVVSALIITKHGEPAVELVAFASVGGIDFVQTG